MSDLEIKSKDQGLTFGSALKCIEDLERKVEKIPYGSGRRTKERQVQCQACLRWKYANERCNLFTTVKVAR